MLDFLRFYASYMYIQVYELDSLISLYIVSGHHENLSMQYTENFFLL